MTKMAEDLTAQMRERKKKGESVEDEVLFFIEASCYLEHTIVALQCSMGYRFFCTKQTVRPSEFFLFHK